MIELRRCPWNLEKLDQVQDVAAYINHANEQITKNDYVVSDRHIDEDDLEETIELFCGCRLFRTRKLEQTRRKL